MAQFPGITLTAAGLNMIAESQASGTALIFTNLKMGDGTVSAGEDIKAFTAVKNPMLTAPIQSFTNEGAGQVKLRFTISNGSLTTGFFARELGIYAKIGESGTEQLYAYTNAGNLTDYIPDKNTPIDEQIIDIYLVVGNASSVSVVTDGSIMYVTMLDLSEHDESTGAHTELMAAHNAATDAHAGLLHLRQNTKTYTVGDIAYSPTLPSWARLECVVAGTTAATEPEEFASVVAGGALVLDGSTAWIIDDMRDGTAIGRVTADLVVRPGYIKVNGATVTRSAYPRLWKFASDNSLTTADTTTYPGLFGVGDGATTFVLPDWRGVVQRFLDDGKGYDVDRVLGSYESDMLKSHEHEARSALGLDRTTGSNALVAYDSTVGTPKSPGAVSKTGGIETRMKNIAELAVIRY